MQIDRDDLDDIATGATVLGTGGGGDPQIGRLIAAQAIEHNDPVELLDPRDLPDDALIVPSAMVGAPTVIVERLPGGTEFVPAIKRLEGHLGEEIYATMSMEVGGLNSTIPIATAAMADLPLVDADGMGRAFPEVQMVTLTLGGVDATPMTMADEHGNTVLLETVDNHAAERFARAVSVEMGGSAAVAQYAHSGAACREHAVLDSISRSQAIGRTIHRARGTGHDPVAALLDEVDGYQLVRGKIVDVDRRTEGGFAVGSTTVEGTGDGRKVTVEFQNENLLARESDDVIASVPDLITVVDAETAEPITTEGLRFGQRVRVIAMPCAEQWRTDGGIDLGGPRAFGYDIDYTPIEVLRGDSA